MRDAENRQAGKTGREDALSLTAIFCEDNHGDWTTRIDLRAVQRCDQRGSRMLFAYIGPETMMPVASILAAVTGVFMMFGRSIYMFCRGIVRRILPASKRK
jgi:hypothetical protein